MDDVMGALEGDCLWGQDSVMETASARATEDPSGQSQRTSPRLIVTSSSFIFF